MYGLTLEDSSNRRVEYILRAGYAGRSLLDIVDKCMGGDEALGNNNSLAWQQGHCTIGDVMSSAGAGLSGVGALRVGVGDGQVNSRDWAVLMPLTGNGNGDYKGYDVWCFGGETETNNGATGQVRIYGMMEPPAPPEAECVVGGAGCCISDAEP